MTDKSNTQKGNKDIQMIEEETETTQLFSTDQDDSSVNDEVASITRNVQELQVNVMRHDA